MDNKLKHFLVRSLDKKYLDLIIYPTEQCNFRCTYCYEDFSIGKMSPQIVSAVKNLVTKRFFDLDHLHFSWFGGEPLLGKEIITEISEHAFGLKREKDIKVTGSMTTNGYHLSVDTMKYLNNFEIKRFQISLDGFGEAHNMTRKLMSGKGSFDRIWGNLLKLSQSDCEFSILLRMHITPENMDSMKYLAERVKAEFGNDKRFEPFVKPIGDWGGPNTGKISSLSAEEKQKAEKEIVSILLNKPEKSVSNEKKVRPIVNLDEYFYQPSICYASKPNSLAIRADGKIQKCTVMLKDDRNTVGEIDQEGNISLDQEKMKVWMRGYQDGDSKILSCPATKIPKAPSKSEIPIVQIA